ncbi:unnamed protein product, partial [Medioppia subpectinata]
DHDQLLNYTIWGLCVEPTEHNRANPDAVAIVEREMSDIYGKEWRDSGNLSYYQTLMHRTDNHELFSAINFCGVFIILFDDYLDNIFDIDEIRQWQHKYRTGQSDGQTPMDRMLVKAIARLNHWLSIEQMRRHANYVCDFIETYITLMQFKLSPNEHGDIMSYEEFLALRQADSLYNLLFLFTELSSGFDPHQHGMGDSELLEAFTVACGKHCTLTNELYSFRKEVRAGAGDYNYMYLIMCREGCTAQVAANRIVMELHDIWALGVNYGAQLKALANPALDQYVSEALHTVKGHLYWASICRRYK